MSPAPRKFYLAFLPEPTLSKVGIHCTHMYFGMLTTIKSMMVISQVDAFFKEKHPVKMPTVVYDREQIFDGPVRVLTARDPKNFAQFQPLRDIFSDHDMISTKYPFCPHVSTQSANRIDLSFTRYAFVKDGFVIRSWVIDPI